VKEEDVDFAKLIEQRDKFVADVATTLERRGIDASAIKNPVDVQAEQARRVRERIDSLEARKADVIAVIDTELAELKRDLKGREQQIATAGKAPDAPSVTGAPVIKKSGLAAGPARAARKVSMAASPVAKKAGATARPAAGKKGGGRSKRK
jgi:hypothetical protein